MKNGYLAVIAFAVLVIALFIAVYTLSGPMLTSYDEDDVHCVASNRGGISCYREFRQP